LYISVNNTNGQHLGKANFCLEPVSFLHVQATHVVLGINGACQSVYHPQSVRETSVDHARVFDVLIGHALAGDALTSLKQAHDCMYGLSTGIHVCSHACHAESTSIPVPSWQEEREFAEEQNSDCLYIRQGKWPHMFRQGTFKIVSRILMI
jgi:hypothetical protein